MHAQVREVDPVGRVAVFEFLQAEVEPLGPQPLHRQAELSAPVAFPADQPIYELLDVHLPLGGFAQAEPGVLQHPFAHHDPSAEKAEGRKRSVEPPGVEKRVVLEILHIELLDAHAAEQADIDPPDTDGGAQPARNLLRGLVYHHVLNGRNVEQQGGENRQHDQQQNDCREHLSQYFYTFAQYKVV